MNEDVVREGFGRVLAEARTAKGLSVADVSEKLKLTVRQIEALEAEDFSRLPSAVFVRGFARNYARLLGISLDELPGVSERAVEPTSTITAHSEDVVFRTSPVRRWLILPLIGVILFLALVAGLYNWLRQGEDSYLASTTPATQPAATPIPATPPAAAPTPVPLPQSVPAPSTATAPTVPVAPEKPATPAAAVPDAAQPTTNSVPAAESSPRAEAAPDSSSYSFGTALPGRHTAHFVAQDGDSWIQVTTAENHRYAKLLHSGGQLTVHGAQPMQVVVGNAAHVQVSYDDKPVAMRLSAGDTVARLTLQ